MSSNRSLYFPKAHFSADDVPPEGLVVRIGKLEMKRIGSDQKNKLVISFSGQNKGLVCNITNYDLIAALLGPNEEDWIGKAIELYQTTTMMQGKVMPCIRVRAPTRKGATVQQVKTPAPSVSSPPSVSAQDEEPPLESYELAGQWEPDDEAA